MTADDLYDEIAETQYDASTVAALVPLRPYTDPRWVVEVSGDAIEDPATIADELELCRRVDYVADVIGWPFDRIVTTCDDRDELRYYGVRWRRPG